MIVVEGMDNSGKTTLVSRLRFATGASVIKSCGPQEDYKDLFLWTRQQLERPNTRPLYIYDRFTIISDPIYSSVIRDKNPFFEHPEGRLLIEEFLKQEPLIIYCNPGLERITKFGKRAQMEGVIENAEELFEKYEEMIRYLRVRGGHVKNFDYNSWGDTREVGISVVEYIRSRLEKGGYFNG